MIVCVHFRGEDWDVDVTDRMVPEWLFCGLTLDGHCALNITVEEQARIAEQIMDALYDQALCENPFE